MKMCIGILSKKRRIANFCAHSDYRKLILENFHKIEKRDPENRVSFFVLTIWAKEAKV